MGIITWLNTTSTAYRKWTAWSATRNTKALKKKGVKKDLQTVKVPIL